MICTVLFQLKLPCLKQESPAGFETVMKADVHAWERCCHPPKWPWDPTYCSPSGWALLQAWSESVEHPCRSQQPGHLVGRWALRWGSGTLVERSYSGWQREPGISRPDGGEFLVLIVCKDGHNISFPGACPFCNVALLLLSCWGEVDFSSS